MKKLLLIAFITSFLFSQYKYGENEVIVQRYPEGEKKLVVTYQGKGADEIVVGKMWFRKDGGKEKEISFDNGDTLFYKSYIAEGDVSLEYKDNKRWNGEAYAINTYDDIYYQVYAKLKYAEGNVVEIIPYRGGKPYEYFKNENSYIFQGRIEDISKILIEKETEAIKLISIDTTWQISGNDSLITKARSIENFFDKVLTVKRGAIISYNPNKYDKYSISDSLGVHLTLFNSMNEIIAYYVFGRSKSDYSHAYIRIGNDPNVYLTDNNVFFMLSISETYWGRGG